MTFHNLLIITATIFSIVTNSEANDIFLKQNLARSSKKSKALNDFVSQCALNAVCLAEASLFPPDPKINTIISMNNCEYFIHGFVGVPRYSLLPDQMGGILADFTNVIIPSASVPMDSVLSEADFNALREAGDRGVTLILMGSEGYDLQFINQLYGLTLSRNCRASEGDVARRNEDAVGTPFAEGPEELVYKPDIHCISSQSLPPDSKVLYSNGDSVWVASLLGGKLLFLASSWITKGVKDGDWDKVLALAMGSSELACIPTPAPTNPPSMAPSLNPSAVPTTSPTSVPSAGPTAIPTANPTLVPTSVPTAVPTTGPTAVPSLAPTAVPTAAPTTFPTSVPSAGPTAIPTANPTVVPTSVPTALPTTGPTAVPSLAPTAVPTAAPTTSPTSVPSAGPTAILTANPTLVPTSVPTAVPTTGPTAFDWFSTLSENSLPSAAPTPKSCEDTAVVLLDTDLANGLLNGINNFILPEQESSSFLDHLSSADVEELRRFTDSGGTVLAAGSNREGKGYDVDFINLIIGTQLESVQVEEPEVVTIKERKSKDQPLFFLTTEGISVMAVLTFCCFLTVGFGTRCCGKKFHDRTTPAVGDRGEKENKCVEESDVLSSSDIQIVNFVEGESDEESQEEEEEENQEEEIVEDESDEYSF